MSETHGLRLRLKHLLDMAERSDNEEVHDDVAWMIGNLPKSEVAINKEILMINHPKLAEQIASCTPLRRTKAIAVLRGLRGREDLKGQVADVLLQIIEAYHAESSSGEAHHEI